MLEDYDVRVLHCDEDKFDILTWFWVVVLPELVLIYSSDTEYGLYFFKLLPFLFIIVCIMPFKYLVKRWVCGIIWFWVLILIWFELPLWFYAVYLSVPIAWFVKHKIEKRKQQ